MPDTAGFVSKTKLILLEESRVALKGLQSLFLAICMRVHIPPMKTSLFVLSCSIIERKIKELQSIISIGAISSRTAALISKYISKCGVIYLQERRLRHVEISSTSIYFKTHSYTKSGCAN